MLSRVARCAAALALATLPARAGAVAWGYAPVTVTLAPGLTATRETASCGHPTYAPTCFAWRVAGLAAPLPSALASAHMFASARGGRVVAAHAGGVSFTDDRGAHWREARWESTYRPLSIAFDTGSDFGAAVGPNGSVWTTEDRGETWRLRRDRSGQVLVDVAVTGHTVAFSDAQGGVWISPDGGTSVRTLADRADGPMPTMAVQQGTIWVLLGGAVWWRADASGGIERVERAGPSYR
jgi:photosystem II stability/assembly factor-like uncharacterized protein